MACIKISDAVCKFTFNVLKYPLHDKEQNGWEKNVIAIKPSRIFQMKEVFHNTVEYFQQKKTKRQESFN